jgi:N-acetylneuraminic acid mutarotase
VHHSSEILPYPISRGSAVWVEEQNAIYIFGGRNETDMLDSIMKYTPSNKKITFLDTKLPTVLMGSTAVYDGNYIYIFGGKDYDDFYDTIQRFDPKTEKLQNMSAHLPNPTVGAAAVWTGDHIYFFGGCWGGLVPHKFDSILRYDPTRDNLTIMNSKLTFGRSGLAATWDGGHIYIIGGSDGKLYSDEVFKYSPDNDTLVTLPGKLPTGRLHIQAEYYDGAIYIFGGRGTPTKVYNQILKYDLVTDEVEVLDEKLSSPSELRMHAYDNKNIYIIGGFSGPNDINQFTIFTPGDTDNEILAICPPVNNYEPILIIFLILFFIIAITLYNKYRNKTDQK